MAINYKFEGKKGSRKVIKTIDINEESFISLKKMLDSGKNMEEDVCGPLIDDTYNIFGGNAYGGIAQIAITKLIADVVDGFSEKDQILYTEAEDLVPIIKHALFPMMCYTESQDGLFYNALSFFNTDEEEIRGCLSNFLTSETYKEFDDKFTSATKTNDLPAGEVALGILLYMLSGDEIESEDKIIAN